MKLNFITFMVRDINKTVDFYNKLAGLQVVRRFNPGMGEIVFMSNETNETQLEFIQFEKVEKVNVVGMTMSFQVNGSLEELREKAIELGYDVSEIVNQAPKPSHFTILDPDNISVEFSH